MIFGISLIAWLFRTIPLAGNSITGSKKVCPYVLKSDLAISLAMYAEWFAEIMVRPAIFLLTSFYQYCVAADKSDVAVNDDLGSLITSTLDDVHRYLFTKSKAERDEKLVTVTEWKDFVPALNRHCLVMTPFCDITEWEEKVKVSAT